MIDPSCGKTLFSTLFHNYDCEIQESKLLSTLQKITEFRDWLSLWYKCWKSSMYIDHSSASVGILSQRKQATSPRTMLQTQPSPLYINNCSHWRRTKIVQNLMSPSVAYILMVHLLLEWSSQRKQAPSRRTMLQQNLLLQTQSSSLHQSFQQWERTQIAQSSNAGQ